MILVNRLKAKITNLHWNTLQRVTQDNEDLNRLAGENPALFHVPKLRKKTVNQTDPNFSGRLREHSTDNERHNAGV